MEAGCSWEWTRLVMHTTFVLDLTLMFITRDAHKAVQSGELRQTHTDTCSEESELTTLLN